MAAAAAPLPAARVAAAQAQRHVAQVQSLYSNNELIVLDPGVCIQSRALHVDCCTAMS